MEELVSRKSFARMIDSTEGTISVLVCKGIIPRPCKLGRKAVWPRSQVEAWISANLIQPGDDASAGHKVSDGLTFRHLQNISEGGK